MKLTIVQIVDRGLLATERIHLKALASTDLKYYIVFISNYITAETVSREPEAVNWFGEKPLKAGDNVVLYSRAGKESEKHNSDGTTSYFVYLGKVASQFAHKDKCAILLELGDWETSKKS